MQTLKNLYALYELGRRLGTLRALLDANKIRDSDIGVLCRHCAASLEYMGARRSFIAAEVGGVRSQIALVHNESGESRSGSRREATIWVYVCFFWYGEPLNAYFTGPIKENLNTFQIALSEELKFLPLFAVEEKGNLSIDRLVTAASAGYAPGVLTLLDDFMKREIDEAGRCLAFARPTACGFHILRAVETGMTAYVLAATGSLPPIPCHCLPGLLLRFP